VAVDTYKDQVRMLLARNPLGLEGVTLRKWARGIARNVLPHALETRMTITGNVRAWRHFLGMRSAAGAEPEILRLSAAIYPHLMSYAPEHFGDFTESEGYYGIKLYTPGTWKV
jgi:thymidylate synthase (FAD)